MRENSEFLRVLSKSNRKQRKAILEHCHNELIKCICEISLNLLRGVIPISKSQKDKLKRYKSILRDLIDKKKSIKHKRKQLSQSGGNLLTLLIPPVLSVLGNLLTK